MFDRERGKMVSDDGSELSAFLGKSSRVTGKLVFEGSARIEGNVDGEVVAQETLTIGETAVMNAQVRGAVVLVHGKITGDIVASDRLELRAPAKVVGNITTPSLVIQEGATLDGNCTMGSTQAAADRKPMLVKGDWPPVKSPAEAAL